MNSFRIFFFVVCVCVFLVFFVFRVFVLKVYRSGFRVSGFGPFGLGVWV